MSGWEISIVPREATALYVSISRGPVTPGTREQSNGRFLSRTFPAGESITQSRDPEILWRSPILVFLITSEHALIRVQVPAARSNCNLHSIDYVS